MSTIDYSWDFTKEEFNLDLDFFNEKDQEDKLWQARTGLDTETLCGAIETIIFMSDRPVTLQKIKTQIDPDLPLRVVHESIARLQEEYEAKHHGIRLMEVAQGYQFRTKATYSRIIQSMFKVSSLQLSPTALEVLAIIAYKQPISKTTVEAIRGVDSSHIVRALMDKRLVKICGRSEEMGRPSLFSTTTEFLEIFNLNEITDLPTEIELEEIATANELGEISEIKTIVNSGDKKLFNFDEFEELEALSSSIKDISSDTLFIQSLKDMDKKRNTEEGVEKKSAFDILEEYVNKAQIVEANKVSVESDVLSSVMEPRSVAASMLHDLLNTPQFDEDEIEIEFEVDADFAKELPAVSETNFEEMNTPDVNSIELRAEEILEKSEELVESLINNPEEAIAFHTEELETEIDDAFDALLADTSVQGVEEVTEAKELSDALDNAFENLMGTSSNTSETTEELISEGMEILDDLTSEAVRAAKELDIDLDFMQETNSSETEDENTQNIE